MESRVEKGKASSDIPGVAFVFAGIGAGVHVHVRRLAEQKWESEQAESASKQQVNVPGVAFRSAGQVDHLGRHARPRLLLLLRRGEALGQQVGGLLADL